MRKLFYISFTFMIIFLAGCKKDWLEINDDPNNPKEVTPEFLFTSGVASTAAVVGGYYNLLGMFWSQHVTQSNTSNQYKYIDSYSILTTDFARQWNELYGGALLDFKILKEKAKEINNNQLIYMTTVMECYVWQILTDLYGSIPFNEALRFESDNILNPKYDSPETVYDSITARLKSLDKIEFSKISDNYIKYDLIFSKESKTLKIEDWVRFKNTLLLKIYLRQMYIRPELAQSGIQELYSQGALFLDKDAKLDIFVDEPSKDNPLYSEDRRNLNTTRNIKASATLFYYLEANGDPRIYYIYDFTKAAMMPLPQGGNSIPNTDDGILSDDVPVLYLDPKDPVFFLSHAESLFLQAEAVAKGWGIGDAKALYDEAVSVSFLKYEEDASSFIQTAGVYEFPSTGTFEDQQKAIIMQKWISLAGSEGIEAFFETNRTKYPIVSSVIYTIGGLNSDYNIWSGGELMYSISGVTGYNAFPKRLIYPNTEQDRNVNCPKGELITSKVWWDVK